jgi:hypothetical protein
MRVMNREVSLAVGERLAAQPDVAESFWPGDILAMSEYHRELARAGDPRIALLLQRLLYAAIEGNPGGPRMAIGSDFVHQMWTVVGTDLLKIIHYEITRLPDGRLLRLACQAGDTVLPHARQAIGTEPAGLLMREIGTLHLDPYLDPRGPKGQPLDDPRQHWLERLRDERGDELVYPSPTWKCRLPSTRWEPRRITCATRFRCLTAIPGAPRSRRWRRR